MYRGSICTYMCIYLFAYVCVGLVYNCTYCICILALCMHLCMHVCMYACMYSFSTAHSLITYDSSSPVSFCLTSMAELISHSAPHSKQGGRSDEGPREVTRTLMYTEGGDASPGGGRGGGGRSMVLLQGSSSVGELSVVSRASPFSSFYEGVLWVWHV